MLLICALSACASGESTAEGGGTEGQDLAADSAAGSEDAEKQLQIFQDKTQSSDARMSAGFAIATLPAPKLVPAMMKVIEQDSDLAVVGIAISTLKSVDEAKAVEALEALLKSEGKGPIKSYAINSLGRVKSDKIVPLLMQSLKDPDGQVRVSSFKLLGAIQDKQALPALKEALKVEKNEKIREFAKGVVASFE